MYLYPLHRATDVDSISVVSELSNSDSQLVAPAFSTAFSNAASCSGSVQLYSLLSNCTVHTLPVCSLTTSPEFGRTSTTRASQQPFMYVN